MFGIFTCSDISFIGEQLTKCQVERRRGLENRAPGSFIPRCKQDGGFEEIQCHGSMCFCVDKDGREISETKVSRPETPNCLVPRPKGVK